MAKVYSWAISETKYGYIINPNDTNKDVLTTNTSAYITDDKLTGNDLELIKVWAANCSDDEYIIQFDRLKELCKSENIKVNFEDVEAYLNIYSTCDDLSGPKGKDGRGIIKIDFDHSDETKKETVYKIFYTDGTYSTFSVFNGQDGKDGVKGDKGNTQITIFIYSSGTINSDGTMERPNKPNGGKYNFNTNEIISLPNGWSQDDNIEPPIFMSNGIFRSEDAGVDGISTPRQWSEPIQITGDNGEPGADGTSTEFIYKRTKKQTDKVEKPISENKNGDVPEGWTDHPTGVTEDDKVEWVCSRNKITDKDTGELVWGEWNGPSLWSKYGENGQDGDGVQYIYLLTEKGTKPQNPTPNDWETNELYQNKNLEWLPGAYDEATNKFDGKFNGVTWTDNPSGTSIEMQYEWVCTRKYKKISDEETDKKWTQFTGPSLWAKYGEKGTSGTVIRKLYRLKKNSNTSDVPDLPSNDNYKQWVGVFPKYDPSTDVVWETECELNADSGKEVYRYKLISRDKLDNDGNPVLDNEGKPIVEYDKPLSDYDYISLTTIPLLQHEVDGVKYNFILMKDDKRLYEWKGGWDTPRIVSGIKGDTGAAANREQYIYCYYNRYRKPDKPNVVGSSFDIFETQYGYTTDDVTWYDQPFSNIGSDDDTKRWYRCLCYIYGASNNIARCGEVEYSSVYDGDEYVSTIIFASGIYENGVFKAPDAPTKAKYDFAENKIIDLDNGWTENDEVTPPIYACRGTFRSSNPSQVTWSSPVQWSGPEGPAGEDGTLIEFIYKLENKLLTEADRPANKSNEDKYVPEGWTDHPTGVSIEYHSEWMCQRFKNKDTNTGKLVWSEWNGPSLWSKYGINGQDGDGVQYIYLLTETDKEPQNPTPNDWETNELYQNKNLEWLPGAYDEATNKFDGKFNDVTWTDNPSGTSIGKPYEWVCSRKYDGSQKKWQRFSNPKIWGKFGENGERIEYRYQVTDNSDKIPTVFVENYLYPSLPKETPLPDGYEENWTSTYSKNVGINQAIWRIEARVKQYAGYDNEGKEYTYWDFVKETEGWTTPIRINGEKGSVGKQGLPGIGFKSVYCLGTNTNYFGQNIITNTDEVTKLDDLLKNGWFSTSTIPDTDIIRYEYDDNNRFKNFLIGHEGILKTSSNEGRVLKVTKDESDNYYLIHYNYTDECLKLAPFNNSNINILNNLEYDDGKSIIENIDKINTINNGDINETNIWLWSTQGEEVFDANYQTIGYNWCKPFKTQGSRGIDGVKGRVIYCAGNYNTTEVYRVTNDSAPYVYDTIGEAFYLLNQDNAVWLGKLPDELAGVPDDELPDKYKGVTPQDLNNEGGPQTPAYDYANNQTPLWEKFESIKALYASVAVINMGTIGASVYAGDFMFSQYGKIGNGRNETNGTYLSKIGEDQVKFLSGYTVDANGDYRDGDGKIILTENIDPYAKIDGSWVHTFRPATCINFKTGKMWLQGGKIIFGGGLSGNNTDDNTGNIATKEETRQQLQTTKTEIQATQVKTFYNTKPTPPYKVGDLWIKSNNEGIFVCKQTKNSDTSFSENDWESANKSTTADLSSIEYLKKLFKDGGTEITGGAILTNVIGLKDDEDYITTVINGNPSKEGFGKQLDGTVLAAGIETEDRDGNELSIADDKTTAVVNLKHDGIDSRIGVFRVYEDGIGVDAGNNKNILITEKSIDDDDIKSISFDLKNERGLYVSDYLFEGEFVDKNSYNPKATSNHTFYKWDNGEYKEINWGDITTTDFFEVYPDYKYLKFKGNYYEINDGNGYTLCSGTPSDVTDNNTWVISNNVNTFPRKNSKKYLLYAKHSRVDYYYYIWKNNTYTQLYDEDGDAYYVNKIDASKGYKPNDATDDNTWKVRYSTTSSSTIETMKIGDIPHIYTSVPTSKLENVEYISKKEKNKLIINLLEGDELTQGGIWIGYNNYYTLPILNRGNLCDTPRYEGDTYENASDSEANLKLQNRYQVRDYDISLGTTDILNTKGEFYLKPKDNPTVDLSLKLEGFGDETGGGSVLREVKCKISNACILAKLIRCDKYGNEIFTFKPEKYYNTDSTKIKEDKENNPFRQRWDDTCEVIEYQNKDGEKRYYEKYNEQKFPSDNLSNCNIYAGFDSMKSNGKRVTDTDGQGILIDERYKVMQVFSYDADNTLVNDKDGKRAILTLDFNKNSNLFHDKKEEKSKNVQKNINFSGVFDLDEDSYYKVEFILHFRVRTIYIHGANIQRGKYEYNSQNINGAIELTTKELLFNLKEKVENKEYIKVDGVQVKWDYDKNRYVSNNDTTNDFKEYSISTLLTTYIDYSLIKEIGDNGNKVSTAQECTKIKIKIGSNYEYFKYNGTPIKESKDNYKKDVSFTLTIETHNNNNIATTQQQGDFIVIGKDGIKNYYTYGDKIDEERFKIKFDTCEISNQVTNLVINNLPNSTDGLSNNAIWVDSDGFLKQYKVPQQTT